MHADAIAKLAASCLTPEDAKTFGIEFLPPPKTEEIAGTKCNALHIRYYTIDAKLLPRIWRIRYLRPSVITGAFGEEIKQDKYKHPTGAPPSAYFPKSLDWRTIAQDPNRTIIFTEGELKAACAAKFGFACIGLGGVWSFRSAKRGFRLLPELDAFDWIGRDVVICFDSDVVGREDLLPGQVALAREIQTRGATVRIINPPPLPDGSKCGIDDYAYASDDPQQALKSLFDSATVNHPLDIAMHDFNAQYAFIASNATIYSERLNTLRPLSVVLEELGTQWAQDSQMKLQQVVKRWRVWEGRRVYDEVTYRPGMPKVVTGQSKTSLNLWRGFASSPSPGSIAPWDELLTFLFQTDPAQRVWFERWCAFPFQCPTIKQTTACCIWARKQGIGKSFVGRILGHLYGENYVEIQQNAIEADFNSLIVNKHLINVDDMSAHESRSKADKLKKLITETQMTVSLKYVNDYTVPAVAHYYMSSNWANVLYLTDADERRYFVHHAPEEKPREGLFKDVMAWLAAGGANHLHAHFLSLPMGDYSPQADAPITNSKEEMAYASRSELDDWVIALRDSAPRDLYTAQELAEKFNANAVRRLSPVQIGVALGGLYPRLDQMRIGDERCRLFVVRNAAKWTRASLNQVKEYIQTERAKGL